MAEYGNSSFKKGGRERTCVILTTSIAKMTAE